MIPEDLCSFLRAVLAQYIDGVGLAPFERYLPCVHNVDLCVNSTSANDV